MQLLSEEEGMSCTGLASPNTLPIFSVETFHGFHRSYLVALVTQRVETFWTPKTLAPALIRI